jgi:hypothetical protein
VSEVDNKSLADRLEAAAGSFTSYSAEIERLLWEAAVFVRARQGEPEATCYTEEAQSIEWCRMRNVLRHLRHNHDPYVRMVAYLALGEELPPELAAQFAPR